MKRIITHPLGLRFRDFAVAILVTLLAFSGTNVYSTTRNAGTEAEFNTAYTSSATNDVINITNNLVVTSEITLSKILTINGNGYTISVPKPGLDDMGRLNSVASAFRVFTISGELIINKLILKGGAITAGTGGAIYVASGGKLHLFNSVVCNSQNTFGGGGAISNAGVLYLNNSLVTRNAATSGGGFVNSNVGIMYVENSTFSENRSTSTSGGGGAGENAGILYINNSTISNNQSTEIGGGINNYYGTICMANSSMTGNVAYGSASFTGGAIGNHGGTVRAINSLFAYNYHITGGDVTSPTSYGLDDIVAYSNQSSVFLYNCIYQAALPAGTNNVIGNTQYTGLADGSNNTIFSGGSLSKITDGTGTEIGTATLYRPFLFNTNGLLATTLKSNSYKGTQTRFANNNNVSPVFAYHNNTSNAWVDLVGTSLTTQLVTTDQIGASRASTPVVGAIETASTDALHMFKVNSNPSGTVNGGTIYGDVYISGSSLTITTIPNAGYHFVRWDYAGGIGGTGTASTTNPYTLSVNRNITLVPVFATNTAGTYYITYVGNNNTGGAAPVTASYSAATIISNSGTLIKDGYNYLGWNNNANGAGTDYAVGATYSAGSNLTLYAKWSAVNAPGAGNRAVNLASFIGATKYTTITAALAAAGSGDTVFVAAGTYTEAELFIREGVVVIGGLPATATVSSNRIYPGKAGITTAQQTILNGGGGFGATPHRVATVNGTLDGCVVLNGYSATQGGGVVIRTSGTVQNCFIRGNQCHNKTNTGMGGGAYLIGSAKLLNSVIDFNMAQQGFAVAGSGIAVNNTITNNTKAPTWIKITAGIANKFPYGDLTGTAGTTKDTWFANDYYLAQTLTTAAQYAVFANATAVPNTTTQKIFSTAEKANYNWDAAVTGSVQLLAEYTSALKYLNNLWVANPGRETLPMETVTWYGSLAYSQWIGGSLPTEAEWEYAARRTATGYSNNTYAGTNSDILNYGWYSTNSASTTHPVATKLPNGIGLYDMSGNVFEWSASWYAALTYGADPTGSTTGSNRVYRGGSWNFTVSYLAVTYRVLGGPSSLNNTIGFRPKVQ